MLTFWPVWLAVIRFLASLVFYIVMMTTAGVSSVEEVTTIVDPDIQNQVYKLNVIRGLINWLLGMLTFLSIIIVPIGIYLRATVKKPEPVEKQ